MHRTSSLAADALPSTCVGVGFPTLHHVRVPNGATLFRLYAFGVQVNLEPGKEADIAMELLPRFSSPVEARLTFWAARTKGGMAPASNMVFTLK